MLAMDINSRFFASSTFVGVLLLLLAHTGNAVSSSSSLFPVKIFGPQDTKVGNQWQQQAVKSMPEVTLDIDHDHPRYSKPSFPGDETGDSPFFYCPESDPDNDIFAIDKIVLNPNPPRINQVYVFHAHGYFREWIYEHPDPFRVRATVRREDRDGLDFSIDFNFCDFVDMVEMDGDSTRCPPSVGNGTIHKFEFVDFGISEVQSISAASAAGHLHVNLITQGNYSVKIDVIGNKKRVFCVQSWFELTQPTRWAGRDK